MLLTITTTRHPATDLGYLLHKHPEKLQTFSLSFGQASVFYPEAAPDRCTAALLLEVDPIALVRNRRGPPGEGRALEQYVNDRPYVASSFLSVAIAEVYGTALSGRCNARPDLAAAPIPLQASLPVVPCRGGERFLRKLFEPLGYVIEVARHPLDERFPEWGEGPYHAVTLRAEVRLRDLLSHIYVLVPVLDDDKHYWVGQDEISKLLRHGGDWLAAHPEREEIAARYLKHQRRLTREALLRLTEDDESDPDQEEETRAGEEAVVESRISLNEQRLGAVLAALRECGARRVLDLGCGEGKLLKSLVGEKSFEEIVGLDVSLRALEIASNRLRLEVLPEKQRDRVKLLQGSLLYRDKRLAGYDAAAVVEVIEHLDPPRLKAFERVLFEFAAPRVVVVTTPNAEYNVRFPDLPAGRFRHKDHRFEWTRDEFRAWARGITTAFRYSVRFAPVGPEDADLGPPTQMAIFTKGSAVP
jgi:3' terminal RNA ribose 2'-O-methyltransferase Hen1